jgi:hypothetical protein
MVPDCEHKVATDDLNGIVHAADSNWFVGKFHHGKTPKEEWNNPLLDPNPVYSKHLQERLNHLNSNQKSFQIPRMVFDVGDHASPRDFVSSCSIRNHKLNSAGGHNREHVRKPGNNKFLPLQGQEAE